MNLILVAFYSQIIYFTTYFTFYREMSITVKTAPDPKDVTDFRFQGLRKVGFPFSMNESKFELFCLFRFGWGAEVV